MRDRRVLRVAALVAVHADPVHLAAAEHALLAHHGHVVLGLAGDQARIAADALRQIDRHAPGAAFVFRLLPQRFERRQVHDVAREMRVLGGLPSVLGERELAHELAQAMAAGLHPHGVDGMVLLRGGQGPFAPGGGKARTGDEVHGPACAERKDVDAHGRDVAPRVAAHLAGCGAAVAQRHRDAPRGLAGHDQGRDLHLTPAAVERDQRAVPDAEPLGGRRTDQRGVVPGELGHRIGRLLEPTVVGEPPVVDRGVLAEDDLQLRVARRAVAGGRARIGRRRAAGELGRRHGPGGVAPEPAFQGGVPLRFPPRAGELPEGLPH